mmetsp:Transcript_95127/g.268756  ORF Transcript_95127/g.268756 Transcript_95127/m.268756 type:complete len:389 (-) Transcript_95127:2061-3227(-)
METHCGNHPLDATALALGKAVQCFVVEGEVPQGVHRRPLHRFVGLVPVHGSRDGLHTSELHDGLAVVHIGESERLESSGDFRTNPRVADMLLEQRQKRRDLVAIVLADGADEDESLVDAQRRVKGLGRKFGAGRARVIALANRLCPAQVGILRDQFLDVGHHFAVAAIPNEIGQVELVALVGLGTRLRPFLCGLGRRGGRRRGLGLSPNCALLGFQSFPHSLVTLRHSFESLSNSLITLGGDLRDAPQSAVSLGLGLAKLSLEIVTLSHRLRSTPLSLLTLDCGLVAATLHLAQPTLQLSGAGVELSVLLLRVVASTLQLGHIIAEAGDLGKQRRRHVLGGEFQAMLRNRLRYLHRGLVGLVPDPFGGDEHRLCLNWRLQCCRPKSSS